MATTLPADLKIYQEQFYGGYYEVVAQQVEVFGAASANALILRTLNHKGDYVQEAFNKYVSGLVTRRDITSVASATAVKATQDEKVSVKVHRKVLIEWAAFAAEHAGSTLDEQFFAAGRQAALDELADKVNTCLGAVSAAISGVSGLVLDAGASTISHVLLSRAMFKMGDRAQAIKAWVMHSTIFANLVEQAIADKIDSVAGVVIYGGSPGTLGKPVIVTDSPNLIESSDHIVLGLVEGAVICTESAGRRTLVEEVGGNENIIQRLQVEYAYDVAIKGYKWDVGNGGANPDSSTITTASNWDKVATSIKDCAGVRLVVSAAA